MLENGFQTVEITIKSVLFFAFPLQDYRILEMTLEVTRHSTEVATLSVLYFKATVSSLQKHLPHKSHELEKCWSQLWQHGSDKITWRKLTIILSSSCHQILDDNFFTMSCIL